MHKKYSRQSLSFISGVAPLLATLDSTSMEPHRNIRISLLPASMVSTPIELLASPLYAGTLSLIFPYSFFIFKFFTFHFFHNCS